jgi:two-component system, cell cycle sensor histidine kinase and response regulator CckA
MDKRPLQLLIVEDNPTDAELMLRELRAAGFDPNWKRVDTETEFANSLDPKIDIVLSDYSLPQFNGLRALKLLNDRQLGVPFIIVSGSIGEETAAAALRQGAADYLLKDRLARLGQAVEHALKEKRIRDEQRHAEERLREQAEMLDHAHDAIIVRNFDDRLITYWNSGAERLYGWSASEAIGQPVGLVLADPQEIESISSALLVNGEFRGQLKEITKDGRELTVDVWSTLIRRTDGTARSALSINTDVTERKKLEMQLLRAQRLESIGTLASGVAHDLNNVLTPILICAETLQGSDDPADRASAVSLILQSAKRGAGIVKQVLTFARGVEGERVLIQPSHLIEEMIDIARKTFPKSIEISSRYPEDLWSIEADPTQLHQVLLNLCVNARDAMPNGGVLVISAENFAVDENYAAMMPGASAGPHIALRVSDTGAGIPPSILDKIFDPFFTTKDVGRGTGLGLSTTLGIIKSHGGFVSVYSEIDKGTSFKIFLPGIRIGEISRAGETAAESLYGNGEVILLVDDEEAILRVTKMTLESKGYRVLLAHDGPEALAVFAREMNSINAVLTDIALPFMDGVTLIRALQKMKVEMVFIASTGHSVHTRDAELQTLGVTNLLTKPYDTQKLLKTLHDALVRGAN